MCDRDDLREVNIKLDHIMHVQCEIFAMMKISNNSDHKLDKCITLLQKILSNLSSSHLPVSTTSNIEKYISTKKEETIVPRISLQDELLKELKEKIRKREEKKQELINKSHDDKGYTGEGSCDGKGFGKGLGKGKGKGK